jgi:endonuclease/exonuclease/phosphatase family metal-dependent hydrolase
MTDLPLSHRTQASEASLAGWRENVGAPVALDLAVPAPAGARTLAVLSWNVWIGRGDLAALLSRIREGAYAAEGIPAGTPMVALVQEAYRADATIPDACNGSHGRDTYRRRGSDEHDIRRVAEQLGMSLRYAPSMRNGTHRSDRGNAILSTLPLVDAVATELPLALQRRVAVSASVVCGAQTLRVHTAHLDPRGRTARDLLGTAGRLAQIRGLIDVLALHDGVPHILGADLNLARQRQEPAFRALVDAGFVTGIPARDPTWTHTYHRLPRLILDWLLVADEGGAISAADVRRLDEHPQDRGPSVFGSDHHPLLARIDLAP